MASPATPDRRRDVLKLVVPYTLLAILYLVTCQSLWQFPPQTLTAAVLKALPVCYLALFVGTTPHFDRNPLALGSRAGLVLSALGDMCLVWRTTLFLPGMLFFALAHMAYMYGLVAWRRRGGDSYPKGQYVREFALVCGLSYMMVFPGIESWVMAGCVLAYSALLFAMANLALQRHLQERDAASLCGALGGLIFVLSDLLIAVTKWRFPLPCSEGLIMLCYYTSQALITYSAVHSARARRRD